MTDYSDYGVKGDLDDDEEIERGKIVAEYKAMDSQISPSFARITIPHDITKVVGMVVNPNYYETVSPYIQCKRSKKKPQEKIDVREVSAKWKKGDPKVKYYATIADSTYGISRP